ncbi:divalent metal cation transporter [Rhodoblastus sp.]|jgi:NRAMP (natural resistance-associated macrophage protein)-like metal ion transporter|uniref:NRAMP family divalent metal transporter n=1 Tax=Rhodoblastus sp. TaxID=1962975 RepID=UPI002600F837|nr:divalent metal cation transporter [Rhodoblastus sp.]
MNGAADRPLARRNPLRHGLAAWGPGLLVMLADTDAGNVVAAAQAGAQWNFRMLPLVLALIPALYLVQELAARLGLFTGEGFGALVRARFGKRAAVLALAGLALATFGTLVTEFTGVAGIGELYGVSRDVTLPVAGLALLAVAATAAYRRAEQAALAFGLFECAFLIVAWKARPHPAAMMRDFFHAPLGDRGFLFLAAAIVGSTFNPWMVFYQQAATARRAMQPDDLPAIRADTAIGAIVTQVLTGAVLVAAAAALHAGDRVRGLASIGEIGEALAGALGRDNALLVFSIGVAGASFAAAIVASLALSWGVAEVFPASSGARRFLVLYGSGLCGAAALVYFAQDLVWLNIAAQAANALLFPLVVGLLVALTARVLAPPVRQRGARHAIMIVLAASVGLIGLIGSAAAFF